jgi:hypothetical protein
MNYRPITDVWILARAKVNYYGAYPSGFLERARALLGVTEQEAVLHVCGGKAREYPYRGFGSHDQTLDMDPALMPDFCQDARQPLPLNDGAWWNAVLIDRPYTAEDAAHYVPGADKLPGLDLLLRNALNVVRPGGCVGVLDYLVPRPPKKSARFVACIAVWCGYNNRVRVYSVFRREETGATKQNRDLFTDDESQRLSTSLL